MRVFKTRDFARFARREKLSDAALCEAIARAHRGLIDAARGGGLIKQRVSRAGAGRSGGYRTLIAYRHEDVSVFVFGFAKNDIGNIEDSDLAKLKTLAAVYLALDQRLLNAAVDNGKFHEVICDGV